MPNLSGPFYQQNAAEAINLEELMRDYEAVKAIGLERIKILTVDSYERYSEQVNAQNKDLFELNEMEETEYVKKTTLPSLPPDPFQIYLEDRYLGH